MADKTPGVKDFYEEWIEPRIQQVLQLINETTEEMDWSDEQKAEFLSKLNEKINLNSFLKG